jgi:hypothetical protein
MVVSAGEKNSASGMSSKPTMLTSSGTRTPRLASAWTMPSAIWSLLTKMEVKSNGGVRVRA